MRFVYLVAPMNPANLASPGAVPRSDVMTAAEALRGEVGIYLLHRQWQCAIWYAGDLHPVKKGG